MRYEHISRLIAELEHELAAIGYFWSGPKGLLTLQNGAVRTNCMDCLDRTNVVQCSIARNVINLQLLRLGIHSYPEKGLQFYVDFEELFNHGNHIVKTERRFLTLIRATLPPRL